MNNGSKKTVIIFQAIEEYIKSKHWAPTRQEIVKLTGLPTAKILIHLQILKEKQIIWVGSAPRQIAIRPKSDWKND